MNQFRLEYINHYYPDLKKIAQTDPIVNSYLQSYIQGDLKWESMIQGLIISLLEVKKGYEEQMNRRVRIQPIKIQLKGEQLENFKREWMKINSGVNRKDMIFSLEQDEERVKKDFIQVYQEMLYKELLKEDSKIENHEEMGEKLFQNNQEWLKEISHFVDPIDDPKEVENYEVDYFKKGSFPLTKEEIKVFKKWLSDETNLIPTPYKGDFTKESLEAAGLYVIFDNSKNGSAKRRCWIEYNSIRVTPIMWCDRTEPGCFDHLVELLRKKYKEELKNNKAKLLIQKDKLKLIKFK